MFRSVARFPLWLFLLSFVTLYPLAAQEHGTPSSSMNVTGCLQKGIEPGGFTLAGEDGTFWELSGKANLVEHVGHKVTISGHTLQKSKMQEDSMEANEKKEANGKEYHDLAATSVKMVSDSCQ